MNRKKAIRLAAACGGAAFLLLTRPLINLQDLSPETLSPMWAATGGQAFVPSSGGRVKTNMLLSILDNGVEEFPAAKPAGTYRIFCVGGSTTRGWPFHEKVSYPALLGLYLEDLFSSRNVEVINAGFMRSDSTGDLALLEELAAYSPDLVIAYEGRNELFNYPIHRGPYSALARAHYWALRNLYPYFKAWIWLDARIKSDPFPAARKLLNSAPYLTAQNRKINRLLEQNLAAMAALAEKHKFKLLLLTQVLDSGEAANKKCLLNALNATVRDTARKGPALCDLEAAFPAAPAARKELVIPNPWVHPDLGGSLLVSRTVLKALLAEGLLPARPAAAGPGLKFEADSAYLARLGVTPAYLKGIYDRLGAAFAKAGAVKISKFYYSRPLPR